MGETNRGNDIVLLLDSYSKDAEKLYKSFELAGIDVRTIVIDDDGFLPDGVISIFEYYLGNFAGEEGIKGRPRYFNEVEIPPYWEIEGNNRQATIKDKSHERGRIYFAEPRHKRFVRVVDWLDEKGTVRLCNHYNKYGALYAKTTFNAKGEKVMKSYYDAQNREVIVDNYVTGDTILEKGGVTRVFRSKIDFVKYFFEENSLTDCTIYYNSLWIPFFVSEALPENGKKDILFWQEGRRNDIPGNMLGILGNTAKRTGRVLVQKRASYDALIQLGANKEVLHRWGFVYPFTKENMGSREALICTNSDQIVHLEDMLDALPEIHFNIAAITEMSSKLMNLSDRANVTLYPGAKVSAIEKLFAKCDIYFDTNRYDEIVSAVESAFLANQVIFAFDETKHNTIYTLPDNIYKEDNWKDLVGEVKSILMNPEMMKERVRLQREYAMTMEKEEWQLFKQ